MEQDLAAFIVKSIVVQPEAVSVSEGERHGRRVLRIRVAQKDMARVMGSRGLVIRAIRTIVLSAHPEFAEVIVDESGS
jgi:predicted RNA-binding protein YlqC (UPF0109 family)